MLDLVGNPEDRFSVDVAHLIPILNSSFDLDSETWAAIEPSSESVVSTCHIKA